MEVYDPLYAQFFYYFNEKQDYYECHEVMEALWLENGRDRFYQGLLQVAVGLYHHQQNNVSGAIKLLQAACEKLNGYPDLERGIHLSRLRKASERYLDQLLRYDQTPFEPYGLHIQLCDHQLQEMVQELIITPPEHH